MSRNQTDAKRQTIAASLVGFALLLGATPAAFADQPAAPSGETFAFPFAYSAQDLNTEAGAADVLERLHQQVRRHCRANGGRSVKDLQLARQCADETMETTVSTIGSSRLAQSYKNRTDG